MRLRKLAACAAAIMCAAAITTVPASATLATVAESGFVKSSTGQFLVMLYSDGTYDKSDKDITNYGIDCRAIDTVEVTITCDVKKASMGSSNAGTFSNNFGGGIVMSSKSASDASSHNWNALQFWGVEDPDFGYTADASKDVKFTKVADGEYVCVVKLTDDKKTKVIEDYDFVQFAVQDWGQDNVAVKSIVMKDASGKELISFDSNGKANLDLKPIEEKAAEEETKTEEKAEEETKAEEKTEEKAEEETKAEETAAAAEEVEEEVLEANPQTGTYTAEFGAQFDSKLGDEWPSFADKTVKFDYDKECTIKLDMGSEVAFGGNYIAINTDAPYVEGVSTAAIKSFKLDGKEIKLGDVYLNEEGIDGGLRLTLLNKWNDKITEQPLNTDDLPEKFQTIEITFVVDTPAEAEVSVDEAEVDWSQWDEAAATKNNLEFQLGGKIDILAAVGEGWDDFTKVEADFTWDAGTGWCGGAGIGGGATLADGTSWIAGPEFGAANANEGVVNDGKATQTIIDMNGETLATIAAVNDDGTSSFGELQVQNWWNGTEANAKVAALRFIAADGTVIKELVFSDSAEVTTTGDVAAVADSSKENPATGVADVAAAAGIAVVAAGVIVVAKKRK